MKPEIETIALGMGVSAEAVRKWRVRGGVAHRWRIPLLHKAASAGIALSVNDLDWQPSEAA